MIDPEQFLEFCIIPTLKWIELDSLSARSLVLGTGLVETNLTYINQIGSTKIGPAAGIYQMEEPTYQDIWDNFLAFHKTLGNKIKWLKASYPNTNAWCQLPTNLSLATAMCRVHYYRVKDPLPDSSDLIGLADYWKTHYNTKLGKGTVSTGQFARAVSVVMASNRRNPI
jgi:hypothetical protein